MHATQPLGLVFCRLKNNACVSLFYVLFNKRVGVFYNPIREFIERFQKHSTKSMSLGSPNKGSNCEGKILAYKKNKLCLIFYSLYKEY